jgi:hypothetical protein
MVSHLLLLIVFSFFVATVFAVLLRDDVTDQLRLGARILGGMIAAAVAMGWLLYPLPL